MAKVEGNSASSPKPKKSRKQEAFEREAREKLENADMSKFDQMMKALSSDLLRIQNIHVKEKAPGCPEPSL